ncbi:MAG: prepilin peptidase [Oscillospiraceae bacterium]|nr:prepilin peptidase [Oscillospiraceae bacterium]
MAGVRLTGGALWYFGCLTAVLGACLGSFLNCAAWRMARGESFLRGRSRCPVCGHVLGPAELVPVLSWLLLRGKCRHCGAAISPRYMLTELISAALALLCLLRFGLGVLFLRNLAFLCCLLCLSLVDWEISEIPDGCLLFSAAVWAAAAPFSCSGWREAGLRIAAGLGFALALLLLSLAMDRALKKDSLGGGDIKLFAVVGLYLGFAGTLLALILACVLGLLLAAALRRGAGEPFPFGPAIAAAAGIVLLWGDGPVAWYLGLLAP